MPQMIGSIDTPAYAVDVAVAQSYAYVADYGSGLQVLPIQCPSADVGDNSISPRPFLSIYPNPSRGHALVTYQMLANGPLTASVYDVAGRRVRGLTTGFFRAGTHRLLWDGHDENDLPAPAGTYLVRLATADEIAAIRFVLVR
ncbi:MAG: T9SS type A sorting domain-containing protein [Candidatus Eisenbacteria sp.]|nr:T9SS type A sorting domain-containing protein [Candidatus Eisenbacteria bacterium]